MILRCGVEIWANVKCLKCLGMQLGHLHTEHGLIALSLCYKVIMVLSCIAPAHSLVLGIAEGFSCTLCDVVLL